jgi:DNA polymerase III gamma/tau subunit
LYLEDVFGQKPAVSFLKACIKRPDEAPHIFFITGPYGTGKTSITRAFQASLAKATGKQIEYFELDSTDEIMKSAEYVRMLVMTMARGYKIVCLDEAHKLTHAVQAELLKLLEDNLSNDVFIFLMTNEPDRVNEALRSRLIPLTLDLFTIEECRTYIKGIMALEGIELKPETVTTMAVSSMGHLRNCVKSLDMVVFEGEDAYNTVYATLWGAIESYFTDFSIDDAEAAKSLFKFHPEQLKAFIAVYLREHILLSTGRHYKEPFNPKYHAKLFQNYCKLLGVVKLDQDYQGFLVVFRTLLTNFSKLV